MEALEGLVRERRDRGRVAARVDAVDRVAAEERALAGARVQRVGRRVDALHLVVHDAVVAERPVGRLELDVPALLLEHARPELREEHGVEVDIDEVVEVLRVLRRDRVARLVRHREGVEEGLQRALEQLDERLLERVLARAAEDAVLEDVRHAGVVGRQRGERDAEDLVVVVRRRHRQDLRSGLAVAVERGADAVLGQLVGLEHLEPIEQRGASRRHGRAAAPRRAER